MGGRTRRTSTFESVEPDLRIVAIRGVTATTATGSTDAGYPDVGRHDAGDYDYTRRHPGSPDYDNQDSVPYLIKHGRPDLESSDSRKDVGKKSNREGDVQQTDTCDCGENQEAGLKDKGSHEIANENINREKASRQTRKSPNIDYYEYTSRHLRTQPYHNTTVGSASNDRHGFDLSLQPDDEKISTFLQRANVEIGTLRPGDPILDTENCLSAWSSEGHSVGERSSSLSCSICSTPRDRNSSCGEDIGGDRAPTQLSDNFDLEKLDLCSESSHTVEPSSREDVYRQTECNMWEDDRPSDVSTCRLPVLATTSNERGSPGDSSTPGDVGLLSTWWQRRSGGEGGISANCSLPSIDERQSVAMQGKDGRHSVMATYRAGSHSVTAQAKNGRHYVTVQDKDGQHSVTAQDKDSRHYDTAQDKDSRHYDTAQDKDSRHYDTAQDKDSRHYLTAQDKDSPHYDTAQDKDSRHYDTAQDKDSRHYDTAQDKDSRHYDTAQDKDSRHYLTAQDKDSWHYDTAQEKDNRHYDTAQDKDGRHYDTAQDKDNRHYDTAQDKDGRHYDTAQDKDSRHYDTAQDKNGRHSVTVQDKHGRYSVTVQDKDGRLSVTFQDKKDRHSVTAQDKGGRHYVTTQEKNGLHLAVALDKDGRHSFDQVTGLTDTSLEQVIGWLLEMNKADLLALSNFGIKVTTKHKTLIC